MLPNRKAALLSAALTAATAPALSQEFDAHVSIVDSEACTKDGYLLQHLGEVAAISPSNTTNRDRIISQLDSQIERLARDFEGYAANMTYPKDLAPADMSILETGYAELPPMLERFLKHSGNKFADNVEGIFVDNSTSDMTIDISIGGFDWSDAPHPNCIDLEGPYS